MLPPPVPSNVPAAQLFWLTNGLVPPSVKFWATLLLMFIPPTVMLNTTPLSVNAPMSLTEVIAVLVGLLNCSTLVGSDVGATPPCHAAPTLQDALVVPVQMNVWPNARDCATTPAVA